MRPEQGVLSWLHIGDLHITGEGQQNLADLRRIVALANALPSDSVDFIVLPGDNADDGADEQFALVRDALAPLRLPRHILAGDHDFQPGNLSGFRQAFGGQAPPYALTVQGHRCLFLDVVSAGSGGPDFRIDTAQLDWVERELDDAASAVVFMHTYPADLREGADRLNALLARPQVRCVDMGHTHYNEIANDGRTIFMATRSTGQIEEGPAGFSIAAIDAGCVSWRFKPLDRAWPFVLVTRPADHRLLTLPDQAVEGDCVVRAKVFGDAPIRHVEVSVDAGAWQPMQPVPDQATLWQAHVEHIGRLRVRAQDGLRRLDEDCIEPAPRGPTAVERFADGSDRDRVGVWPEKGILGTQLGPNRNGRQW